MKFEKDFDFESANAQFNKEEIDREFQDKLKLKGVFCFNSFVPCSVVHYVNVYRVGGGMKIHLLNYKL